MRKLRFTIYHGLAASIAIHSALGLPVFLYALAPPPEEPPALVVELQGLVAETQTEEKVLQETKGQPKADAAKPAETPPPPPEAEPPPPQPEAETPQLSEDATPQPKVAQPPPPQPQPQPREAEPPQPKEAQSPPPQPKAAATEINSTAPGSANVKGDEEVEKAQTIKLSEEEIDRLKKYVKGLTKRVQSNLRYPDEGRRAGLQGAATVSFTILSNGQIWPESLKIVESSGQQKLDASALQTVRSSAPFEPPPKQMTVAIAVVFGRKH